MRLCLQKRIRSLNTSHHVHHLPLWTEPLLSSTGLLQYPQPVCLWRWPLHLHLNTTVRMILLNENPLWPHPMGVCSIYGRVSCKRSGCPVPLCSYLLLLSACSSGCSFTGVLAGPQVCQVGSYWQLCTCSSLSELRAPRHLPGVLTPACLSSGFTCPDSLSPLAFPAFLLLSFPP